MIGTQVAKSKNGCLWALLDGHSMLENQGNGVIVDFPQRSGYVELHNAVVLFVTLPMTSGKHVKRNYPNEWLEDGTILSWFVRENDWIDGTSPIAQKMLLGLRNESSPQQQQQDEPLVILFARRGKGQFICCGRCRVMESPKTTTSAKNDGNLVKLLLLLQDRTSLCSKDDFLGCCSWVARVSPKSRNKFRSLDLYNDPLKIDIHIIYAVQRLGQ